MIKYSYILLIFIICWGCSKKKEASIPIAMEISALPHDIAYDAGEEIKLQFKAIDSTGIRMLVEYSMGAITLTPVMKGDTLTFFFPDFVTRKRGLCDWTLLVNNNQKKLQGSLEISPTQTANVAMESYLGPRSITAGNRDFSMHVMAPTDEFDNPLPEGTSISSIHQFGENINSSPVVLKNLIGWQNIYSPLKSGRILVMASCRESNSKEFTTVVYPANATDFKISYERNHDYADGNQVILFSSDIIKDPFDNIVSDGTLVSFLATNAMGVQLKAVGTTLNGIAKARFLHPYEPDTWEVKAYVTGTAESNINRLSFRVAIRDFQTNFNKETNALEVFEIKSFMDQIVPDGIPIKMKVFDLNNALVMENQTTSRLGQGKFKLTREYFEPGDYRIELDVAGLSKEMTISIK